ncbi:inorganic phosphate transporter [Cellulomonas fimi]|uniref:Phosphate transporter n=1 Tax=Cellulomonas fimi (strain ATCC 484 / DSM 20113 / JCM 1341 / CCUG 24087 / LMG 16345 / NBRC 15513 / NCIMB 8980 / NCTC 7547 / NRS-133) TaxID=590998 RepID=F4H5H0_CELFA|nr:inorganic phosphate transporter [Cellulomonas fimi]AEE47893.1 phosphate transporter [Cellulomonas fimi ATCC 484]NNH05969.1 inorganic phosphate transporter [Cellulomonas fimi]VEH37088.1 Low-affinity inorganic phosphate transporter 1 [Cellulomonas fimi]
MDGTLILALVVAAALAFDFTNGFHDTGNAMAASIATGALKPRQAVLLSAALNMVGAFLSLAVAATIAKGIVDQGVVTLPLVVGALAGAIVWNVVTWYLGLPSSSSHALVGALVGATLAAVGTGGVVWAGLVQKVVLPALLAPLIAGTVAALSTALVYRITRRVPEDQRDRRLRWGQMASASMVSLAHGTNDAQKSMGIILLALVAGGAVPAGSDVPLWVVVSCALAMAAGTALGGWRVIRTLGKGLTDIQVPQGMASDTSSASVILVSSAFGFPLSTTQVATGSILGSGVGRREKVRWAVAGRMLVAWLVTLPAAAAFGGLAVGLERVVGGDAGIPAVLGVVAAVCAVIWWRSRRAAVDAGNVTAEWEDTADGPARPAEPVAAGTAPADDALVARPAPVPTPVGV